MSLARFDNLEGVFVRTLACSLVPRVLPLHACHGRPATPGAAGGDLSLLPCAVPGRDSANALRHAGSKQHRHISLLLPRLQYQIAVLIADVL